MVAKTMAGFETILARELKTLGARDVREIKRGVSFTGDLGFLYKANLWLRTALRILVPISEFKIRDEQDLYKRVKNIPWEKYLSSSNTLVIDATVYSKKFKNSLYIAQKSKDAIVDRFREKSKKRPSVDTRNPDIRINVHISNENVSVSLDSSGESLHKRGYRQRADRAPINEVLAAGILMLTGWDGSTNLIDPMCGSGTFLIEGALMAHNIPPNIFRKDFGFKKWKNFDRELHGLIFDKALEKERSFDHKILGFDNDPFVLRKARFNIRKALMTDQIELEEQDIRYFDTALLPDRPNTMIMNPPYGLKIEADIPELYNAIGQSLKHKFQGTEAWVFTSSAQGLKNIGLKPSKKIPLFNGKLESWLVKYELYSGSKKRIDPK